jgi:hypothetical protein
MDLQHYCVLIGKGAMDACVIRMVGRSIIEI